MPALDERRPRRGARGFTARAAQWRRIEEAVRQARIHLVAAHGDCQMDVLVWIGQDRSVKGSSTDSTQPVIAELHDQPAVDRRAFRILLGHASGCTSRCGSGASRRPSCSATLHRPVTASGAWQPAEPASAEARKTARHGSGGVERGVSPRSPHR